jgi:hypothetical protein
MSKEKKETNKKINRSSDLPETAKDKEELKSEETIINLPDVKDIPGQEHVHVPNNSELADTTISSSDEEGEDVWNDEDVTEDSSNVSDDEKAILEEAANDMPTRDERQLREASLDSTDDDGTPLNEKDSFNAISGSDLDVPGAEADDQEEEIGEEDEENNPYSLGGDDNSANEERNGA